MNETVESSVTGLNSGEELREADLELSQELSWADFTPENLLGVIGQVLAAATLVYKMLME